MAEWDAFVSSNGWSGGCALNVDTGENRLGLSMAEAVQLSARVSFLNHGITLLISSMASTEKDRRSAERALKLPGSANFVAFIAGIPTTSLAGSLRHSLQYGDLTSDLVRADSALFGINPIPGSAN